MKRIEKKDKKETYHNLDLQFIDEGWRKEKALNKSSLSILIHKKSMLPFKQLV